MFNKEKYQAKQKVLLTKAKLILNILTLLNILLLNILILLTLITYIFFTCLIL